MKLCEPEIFSLGNFEGPLDLLWHLINRQELDIYEIPLHEIIQQYLTKSFEALSMDIDQGAEFVALASSLIWFKSKTLLPQHEQESSLQDEELDPHFEIIHQLLDYCRFKQAAKQLSEREQYQSAFYLRGVDNDLEAKKNLGINHLSLDDLAALFRQILAKTSTQKGTILEEFWRVSDKIKILQELLKNQKMVPFQAIFTAEKSREELIVTFLALLELMKAGELRVINDPQKTVCILANF